MCVMQMSVWDPEMLICPQVAELVCVGFPQVLYCDLLPQSKDINVGVISNSVYIQLLKNLLKCCGITV